MATLNSYLQEWTGEGGKDRAAVAETLGAIAKACSGISELIAQGPLAGTLGAVHGNNMDGDAQKELDLRSNDLVIDSLQKMPVAFLVSEELDAPLEIQSDAPLIVAIDPLDGSSNIDTNISVGTIFSILPSRTGRNGAGDSIILQQGTRQLAAGYVIYGPQTALVLTIGEGTQIFTLDPRSREFRLTAANVRIPEETREFAINVSNFRHWDRYIRAYVDDCLEGEKGPRESSFNMRWVASLVAECHRILSRGGIFLYPGDDRTGYENGRLRLLYEINPIGWLIEQAGGGATTGSGRVLDLQPTDIHQRAPLIFGSRREVDRVNRYYSELHAVGDRSPLFNQRGLLRP